MGTVYVATHTHLGTAVALKLLHDGNDDASASAAASATATTLHALDGAHVTDEAPSAHRFLKEARLSAHLRHPNLVQVFDFGIAGRRASREQVNRDFLVSSARSAGFHSGWV